MAHFYPKYRQWLISRSVLLLIVISWSVVFLFALRLFLAFRNFIGFLRSTLRWRKSAIFFSFTIKVYCKNPFGNRGGSYRFLFDYFWVEVFLSCVCAHLSQNSGRDLVFVILQQPAEESRITNEPFTVTPFWPFLSQQDARRGKYSHYRQWWG